MRFNYELPKKEWSIMKTLILNGFQCFLVGGAVRDIILGLAPSDFDFATNAKPEEIKEMFYASNKVDFVGASFGVTLVDGIEVATFRGDRYNGGGDKDVVITYVDTIEEDLARRDFTINSMALDINGNLIDPFCGLADLYRIDGPIIRFTGNAYHRIAEDPNRIIRAFRFAARFNGIVDDNTMDAIRDSYSKFSMIAPERIRLEILKTMETVKNASKFWELMFMSGMLELVIPELEDGVDHPHGNYHAESIWEHNMIAGDTVSCEFPLVKLAAYLHDCGKPRAYNKEDGSFHDHQHIGADIVRHHLTRLKFSNDEIKFIVNLVLIHMDGSRGITAKSRRKLKNKLGKYGLDWHDYIRLRISDRTANLSRDNFTISEIKDYVNMFILDETVPMSTNDLALSGGKIIESFALTPGPIVSTIQKELLNYIIEEGDEVNNVESLIIFIKEKFNLTLDNNN